MAAKIRTPFSSPMSKDTPSLKGNTGGGFDSHNNPVVSKPHDGEIPTKFYSGDANLKPGNSVKVSSPMSNMKK